MRTGILQSSVVFDKEVRGLWSVSAMKFIPRAYSANRSQAHVTAKASFSITA